MEEKILEKLNEIYNKHVYIDVKFMDFRIYEIIINICNDLESVAFKYQYNAKLTFDYNINIIEHEIDRRIVKLFKEDEEICQE